MQMPSSVSTRLQYQHKCLLDIIDGLSDEQIRQRIMPDKWSIFENIVHLQTYQHIMIARIKQILDLESPLFERYKADDDPEFIQNCTKSSREILQDLISTRKEMSAALLTFNEKDLVRTGKHPAYGNMNLLQWFNFFLLHEAHHLFVIFKMASTLRTDAAMH
jgi:uncharacterized damage-inducible protein DinB